MVPSTTVARIIDAGNDDAVAITAPDRPSLTYGQLRRHVETTLATLNGLGIGRHDRVAIVLPNGVEMATAFLSIAAGAATAPLNPAYQQQEFHFYLSDLGAKVLLVEAGSRSPAVAAAASLKLPVLELTANADDPAGTFTLSAAGGDLPQTAPSADGPAEADDVALLLHTSGTTSRPKLVPLSQRNICASAHHIGRTLQLHPHDRCLNVMPLFHIHGLMAAVLASVCAGASVYCTPGFNAMRFYGWFQEAEPTWYTAVPTMHQAILGRAPAHRNVIAAGTLRFIRSSSAPLPPQVMAELEKTFDVPVVEAYAMTEAAHQMTCNPLPPARRIAGSVGPAAGPQVAIMDASGTLLPAGQVGEVVIRGPNVTAGYENNPQANAECFTNGYFRTGDQGVLNAEGYLRLTGRLKELINRGGEKISPREVDEVILDHPSVAQVVTFAMPHAKLGEEVAAAVVLAEGAQVTERDLKAFSRQRLAPFKVPRQIVFVSQIPKGPTGKLQRIGLAEKLELA